VKYPDATEKRLDNILQEQLNNPAFSNILRYKAKDIFAGRFAHHIRNLFDGLLKLNHLEELNRHILKRSQDKAVLIQPREQDYQDLVDLVQLTLITWGPTQSYSGLTYNVKLFLLSPGERDLFEYLKEKGRVTSWDLPRKLDKNGLERLITLGLINEVKGGLDTLYEISKN
jgi:hypothetical protein